MVRSADVACVRRIVARGSRADRFSGHELVWTHGCRAANVGLTWTARPAARRTNPLHRDAGGKASGSPIHGNTQVTWFRSPIRLPLVSVLVVVLFTQPPHAVAQDKNPHAQPAQAVQPQPPPPAPASQAVKPGQPQVPPPTVVLKAGEVPGIAFKEPTYDFGRVRSGTDVTHDFVFTNTGNGPLEILQVKPG